MMLKKVISFIGLFFAQLMFSVTPSTFLDSIVNTDYHNINTYQIVKSIEEITYDAKVNFGEIERGEIKDSSNKVFDNYGNILDIYNFNPQRDLIKAKFYSYNENRKVSKINIFGSSGKLKRRTNGVFSFVYKEEDLKHTIRKYGILRNRWIFNYNSSKKLTEGTLYKSDGSYDEKIKLEYDSHGNCVRELFYGIFGSLDKIIEYEYDSLGNMTQKTFFKSRGKAIDKIIKYEYNSYGELICKISASVSVSRKFEVLLTRALGFETDTLYVDTIETKYEYNDKGELIGIECSDNLSSRKKSFDKHGNLTKIKETGTYPHEYTYSYVFDDKNNWIRRIIYYGVQPTKITERKITY